MQLGRSEDSGEGGEGKHDEEHAPCNANLPLRDTLGVGACYIRVRNRFYGSGFKVQVLGLRIKSLDQFLGFEV